MPARGKSGAQLGVPRCLGICQKSSPVAGKWHPFSGKSFYLDLPAGKNLQFLTGAIQQLGGVIEGFLSKEVSYIVSSRREVKTESSGTSHRGCSSPSDVRVEMPSVADPKGSHARPSQNPADSVPMSRGMELLQKAIRNQGSSSSLLTNARSWGVSILHVDEMTMHVQHLSLDALCVRKHGPEKPEGTCPAESRTQKVARLKAPFLKIEDESSLNPFLKFLFWDPKMQVPLRPRQRPWAAHTIPENPRTKSQAHDQLPAPWPGGRKGAVRAARRPLRNSVGISRVPSTRALPQKPTHMQKSIGSSPGSATASRMSPWRPASPGSHAPQLRIVTLCVLRPCLAASPPVPGQRLPG